MVCRSCGRRQASEYAPGGAPICSECLRLFRSFWKAERREGTAKALHIFREAMKRAKG